MKNIKNENYENIMKSINRDKITVSTFKSMVLNVCNSAFDLYGKVISDYDGMIDGLSYYGSKNTKFNALKKHLFNKQNQHSLGFDNVIYLTPVTKNWFKKYEDSEFIGIECSNSCGSFIIAIKKI